MLKRKALVLTTAAAAIAAGPALAAMEATATTDLNVRSGPGPQYDVVGLIDADAAASVDGCLEAANWCKVSYNGTTGWAYGAYLTAPLGGEPVALQSSPQELEVTTITYEEDNSDGTSAAAVGTMGAVVGSLIGGPAAIAAGAVLGAATGVAVDPNEDTVTYVTESPVDPIYLDGEVVVGAGIPQEIELYDVPTAEYSYLNVNGQTVLVEPSERQIVYVVR